MEGIDNIDKGSLYYLKESFVHMEELLHEDGTSVNLAAIRLVYDNLNDSNEKVTDEILLGMSDLIELGALISQAQVRLIDADLIREEALGTPGDEEEWDL